MSNLENHNLPVVTTEGFGVRDPAERLIQGEILKCIDGRWSTRSGETFEAGKRMLAIKTVRAAQHWELQQPTETIVEEIGQPLPDIKALNDAIPQDQWEDGLDGKPRPPWQLQYVVYLIDPIDGATYTYLNSTNGARVAYDMLKSRIANMQALSGKQVVPLVELGSRLVSKQFNKIGPFFKVVRWLELGNGSTQATSLLTHDTSNGGELTTTRKPKRTGRKPWEDDSDAEPDITAYDED